MTEVLAVRVPDGLTVGDHFYAQAPDGGRTCVAVPAGFPPGSTMHVRVPKAAPMPLAMAAESPSAASGNQPIFEPSYKTTAMVEAPDPEDLTACCALCCIITSCYRKFPECCGCYSKGIFTCLEVEQLCCKPGAYEGSLCMLQKSEWECVRPTTCCKCTKHLCCIDSRCGFPCDEEIPCMISLLCLTCVKDYKCVCSFGKRLQSEDNFNAVLTRQATGSVRRP